MKKVILCFVLAAFAFGCGGSQPAPESTDVDLSTLITELDSMLANQQKVCSDVYFADTRAALLEAHTLDDQNDVTEAGRAYLRAKESYDAALPGYNNAVTYMDSTYAEIADQKSRLADLREDGTMYASNEYGFAEERINQLHMDAEGKLAECNVDGAMADVDDAEKEFFYLEEVISANMGGNTATTAPVSAADVYTVVKGDCLWKIAANKYSNPYFWPLIYWSNQGDIKDPDLIYPGQELTIEDYDQNRKDEATKLAKTRGAWSLYDNK